ncbi:hypothetical protein [Verrucosispora sp. TAA-831]|uniref:hypothetical protein n=1 Tax=Verrucosispora sp. TAA-831 TaxID=3422227 RepID=UPI003D6EA7B6
MSSSSSSSSAGIGAIGLLTIAFIVLKLADVIDWSWWWVLAPAWISAGITLVITAVLIGVVVFRACRRS